jgi:hypothetical protein
MHRPTLIATVAGVLGAGVLGLTAGGGFALAHYCAGPASNFSAYYYQSPGGVAPAARSGSVSTRGSNSDALPYGQSCGSGRVWKNDRCVRE